MFSDTLKNLRKSRGMTQSELADALGVNLRTVQYYESGEHIPKDAAILERISARFDVPLRSLVNSTEFYKMVRAETRSGDPEEDRRELYRILQELTTLFAGGNLSDNDRQLFLDALTELARETRD